MKNLLGNIIKQDIFYNHKLFFLDLCKFLKSFVTFPGFPALNPVCHWGVIRIRTTFYCKKNIYLQNQLIPKLYLYMLQKDFINFYFIIYNSNVC